MTSVPPSFDHPGSPPLRPELPEGAPVPEQPRDDELPSLGVPAWSPFLVVLLAFVVVLLVQTAAVVVVELAGGNVDRIDESDAATIGFTLVLDAALIGCAVIVVRWLSHRRPLPAAFGLRKPAWGPAIGWMAAVYAAFWAVAIVVGIAFGQPEEQDIVTDLKAEDSALILIAFGVMTCLVAPLAEEFFFRGFLFRVLHERLGAVIGVFATGVAFGLVHLPSGDWIGTIVLTLFGMALCVLLLCTSSLLPCIMLHAFHNSISFGFTKELPWWGFLLLIAGSVTTTLAISLLASRAGPRPAPSPA
ncbi:MAG TPA: CPBP family intramembrane glutamic endopeptidase [Solirubrobacteraceae bacterium]|nr:CPBP family intramembrane glutamic endopeptidase [Solirubrobacteraceae bacterium]